ncbi:TonB-dependent receptor [Taibaiella koreensis]|uniref:TonB-dependent receptor n=1 Tax=Taibaiella koreensis TaxID=1268548 RepID=UPI000E59F4E1|nr:TonB-dependent receptor [Taibaiella koreensis]
MKSKLTFLLLIISLQVKAQVLSGTVVDSRSGESLPGATVRVQGKDKAVFTDGRGRFSLTTTDSLATYPLIVSYTGYDNDMLTDQPAGAVTIRLKPQQGLDEVVVTGTLKPVSRAESPIPVEIFTPKFFKKNPSPSLFDAVGMINGVRPQLNCNVCNTGDIHINGMEGPYTLVLIDGMPIVSALSTVYGLSGIPNSIVERLEVVKGPAASLYGSEAMGGIINVITRSPQNAPRFSVDLMATSWQEYNTDLSFKARMGKVQTLLGVSYYNYQQPYDRNHDGFTDVTLQNRISVFNKWDFTRIDNRVASIAARYVYEDRWGGQMDWSRAWRGSDSIYGESIYTSRWELIGQYQLPLKEKIMTQFSVIGHHQDSYYGTVPFLADQKVAFAQLYWDKQWGRHSLLAGASFRYTYYNDNTPGTATVSGEDAPSRTPLPGVFIQDEWSLHRRHKLLLGYRFDYDRVHHAIHSPRLAYKWSPDDRNTLRASFGTGFRVVNLFTEDHAALTGARKVEIEEALKPERSYNSNLNYVLQLPLGNNFINVDATAFYSYFTNKITGDYNTDPNKILYRNLSGHAISQGISLNLSMTFSIPLHIMAGATYMDVYQMNRDAGSGLMVRSNQLFAPKWSGNYAITYTLPYRWIIDLTGQLNGPMRLPLQKDDYRPEYSPLYCLANIQLTKKIGSGLELYGGVKNLLNFVPKETFMRPFDPFDKQVNDPVSNPKGYTFDTEYNYAPLQGIRGFAGIRYMLR